MKKILEKAAAAGIEEAEVYFLDSVKEEVIFESSKLKTVSSSQNAGIAVRAVKDGKMGFVTSSNLDDIDKLVENAVEVCKFSGPKDFKFAENCDMPNGNYAEGRIWEIPMEKLIEDGNRAVDIVRKYNRDVRVNIRFKKETDKINVLNTNGLDSDFKRNKFTSGLKCSLVNGTSFIECGCFSNNLTGEYHMEKLVEKAIEDIELSKKEITVESGKKAIIFTPAALSGILITFQLGVNGSQVERGVSPLIGRIGERILSEKITLIDDGTLENGYDSMVFDDEGTPAQRTVLLEKGILKSYLHTLKTAEKLGYKPTGNGLRQQDLVNTKKFDLAPRPFITNFIMEPGSTKYEDMIKDIKDGVIVDYIMGIFMNNLLNGDFSGNIGLGYVIKDGKITGRIKDAAINENIYTIFRDNVIELSDKTERVGFLGEFGSHFYPHMMLKDINITCK